LLGQTDRARLADALKPGGDVDTIAHQIAVRLFDHVAEMDADAELDAAIFRHADVALDHAALHLDGATHGVDDAAELDEAAVAGALDDAAVMRGDGGIDEIATEAPQARQGAILVGCGEPTVADDVGDQDCRHFPGFAQFASLRPTKRYHRSQLPRARAEADYSGNPNIRAPRIIFSSRAGM
jgi:hypothetical protein